MVSTRQRTEHLDTMEKTIRFDRVNEKKDMKEAESNNWKIDWQVGHSTARKLHIWSQSVPIVNPFQYYSSGSIFQMKFSQTSNKFLSTPEWIFLIHTCINTCMHNCFTHQIFTVLLIFVRWLTWEYISQFILHELSGRHADFSPL